MWASVLTLVFAQTPCPVLGPVDAWPAEIQAQRAVAIARAPGRSESDAAACLDLALELDPNASIALRARAQLRLRQGDASGAAADLARAEALGELDPDLRVLRAIASAEAGDVDAALRFAERAGSWQGDLVGTSLDDPAAAYRAAELLGEPTPRGALSALVLAGREARRGRRADAMELAIQAADDARRADDDGLIGAAGQMQQTLQSRSRLALGGRLRTTVDQISNPGYHAPEDPNLASSVRVAALGELGVGLPLGRVRVQSALRVRQHGLLARRARFCCLDLFSYSLAGSAQLALGPDPTAVVLGLRLRWTDVFADRFRYHYASSLEGGPTLDFRLGPRVSLDLAFLGTYADFIHPSPPDTPVTSLNRDRVGQRVIVGVVFDLGWLDGRLEAMFVNDDAEGDAFDALGGVVAGRLLARPTPDLTLSTGVAVSIREYGPVGDSAVIGAAANRTEIRTVVELGARVRLAAHVDLVLEDVFVNSAARAGHRYTNNVLSVGVQTRW